MTFFQYLFMKEEIVFIVNNVLTRNNILDINWGNLIYLYDVAWELSSKFDADKADAMMKKAYNDIKASIKRNNWQSDRAIEYITNEMSYIKTREYLPDEFKETVCNKLKALKLLYILN